MYTKTNQLRDGYLLSGVIPLVYEVVFKAQAGLNVHDQKQTDSVFACTVPDNTFSNLTAMNSMWILRASEKLRREMLSVNFYCSKGHRRRNG